jgi:hypothetical protein
MYKNGKMRPFTTIPGMRAWRIEEDDRGGEFNYNILKELLLMSQCNP